MNNELIEKAIANPEKYAFENDGTVEQLRQVLKIICPSDPSKSSGDYIYYWHRDSSYWEYSKDKPTNRQIIKISEIFAETFEYGELIEVRDADGRKWEPHIFITALPENAMDRFVVVQDNHKDRFENGESFDWQCFDQARKIQKEEPKGFEGDIAISIIETDKNGIVTNCFFKKHELTKEIDSLAVGFIKEVVKATT